MVDSTAAAAMVVSRVAPTSFAAFELAVRRALGLAQRWRRRFSSNVCALALVQKSYSASNKATRRDRAEL